MAKLMVKSPCAGLLPIRHGDMTLTEVDPDPMAMVQPFKGREADVEVLLGHALPKPGHSSGTAEARVIWFGQESYLTLGFLPDPGLSACAAVSDQSDAWTVVALVGDRAEDVLSRLVPVDLRASAFAPGQCCRTLVEHMNASILRVAADTFHIMVFRSMAHTLVHDLGRSMSLVTGRSGI